MSSTTCPVFRPTLEEFKEFRKYISNINSAFDIGICKIIPPKGWISQAIDFTNVKLVVPSPVRQIVSGRAGVFTVNLFEVPPMDLEAFREFSKLNSPGDCSVEEKQRKFWKSLGNSSPWEDPIYGADMQGSLFPKNEEALGWNISKLDSILRLLGAEVPGVNTSYLYVGAWRAMFAFHTEDLDLYSINYLHTGAPKGWYSIPLGQKSRFETMAQAYFAEDFHECHEFLRHKTKLFSPSQLRAGGLQFSTALQEAGEIIITFPGSYHAGFNYGFNIAESTNFATPRWLEIGRRARRCVCRPHSVRIDMNVLETLYLRYCVQADRNRATASTANGDISFHASAPVLEKEVGVCYESYMYLHEILGFPSDTRFLRCTCRERRGINSKDIQNHGMEAEENLLAHCSCCGCFYHINCNRQLPALNRHSFSQDTKCGYCQRIDNGGDFVNVQENVLNRNTKPIRKKISPKKRKICSNKLDNDVCVDDDVSLERPKENATIILVGSIVTVYPPQAESILTGVVTDIEDSLGRLHVKGTRRDEDIWVDLLAPTCVVLQDDRERNKKLGIAEDPSSSPPMAAAVGISASPNSKPLPRGVEFSCPKCGQTRKGHKCPFVNAVQDANEAEECGKMRSERSYDWVEKGVDSAITPDSAMRSLEEHNERLKRCREVYSAGLGQWSDLSSSPMSTTSPQDEQHLHLPVDEELGQCLKKLAQAGKETEATFLTILQSCLQTYRQNPMKRCFPISEFTARLTSASKEDDASHLTNRMSQLFARQHISPAAVSWMVTRILASFVGQESIGILDKEIQQSC